MLPFKLILLGFAGLVAAQQRCDAVSQYTVVQGDTLFQIALSKGVTLNQIVAANPSIVDANSINPGQLIGVPSASCSPANTCFNGFWKYPVASGDNLSKIASDQRVDFNNLINANPQITNINFIVPGQVINIPCTSQVASPAACSPTGPTTYIVRAGDTLTIIAAAKKVTLEALITANGQITNINSIVPGQVITIPQCAPTTATRSTAPPNSCNAKNTTYEVKSGDTLSKIAEANGVTLDDLLSANSQITDQNAIVPKQVINIPACKAAVPTSNPRCIFKGVTYSVKLGDTLTKIAEANGVTLAELLSVNPEITNPDAIVPKQVIKIPTCTPSAPAPTTTAPHTAAPTTVSRCSFHNATHIARPGDTLNKIASDFGVTLDELLSVNPEITNPDFIRIDQVIKIPTCTRPTTTKTSTPTTTGCPTTSYNIVQGDTLSKLAEENGITLDELLAANKKIVDPNSLFIGQVVKIPNCGHPKKTDVPTGCKAPDSGSGSGSTPGSGAGSPPDSGSGSHSSSSKGSGSGSGPESGSGSAPGSGPESGSAPGSGSGSGSGPESGSGSGSGSAPGPAPTGDTLATCASSGSSLHEVVAGETLFIISKARGITLKAITDANPQITNIDLIYPKQVVAIPVCGQTTPVINVPNCVNSDKPMTYKVKAGDTLGAIAVANNISVDSLAKANPQINRDKIDVDQIIVIPVCGFHVVLQGCPPEDKPKVGRRGEAIENRSVDEFDTVLKRIAFTA